MFLGMTSIQNNTHLKILPNSRGKSNSSLSIIIGPKDEGSPGLNAGVGGRLSVTDILAPTTNISLEVDILKKKQTKTLAWSTKLSKSTIKITYVLIRTRKTTAAHLTVHHRRKISQQTPIGYLSFFFNNTEIENAVNGQKFTKKKRYYTLLSSKITAWKHTVRTMSVTHCERVSSAWGRYSGVSLLGGGSKYKALIGRLRGGCYLVPALAQSATCCSGKTITR